MEDKDLKKIEDMFKHQIGIMSENFQHKLDIVVEGNQMLSDKMDRMKTDLEERIGCVEHKLDIVAAKTDDNTMHINLLSENIDANTDRIDKLDARMDNLDSRMDKLDARMDKLDSTMDKLDARMDKSDTKMDSLANKIDAIAADLADHRRDTEAHSIIYKVKEDQ